MRALLACPGAAALAIALGCGGNVVLGDGGGGTAGGPGNGGGGASPTGGTSPTGGGSNPTGAGVSGNAVILQQPSIEIRVASQSITCQSPSPDTSACGWWQVSIPLPDPALFTPGTIDIGASGIDIFLQESGDPNSPSPGDCPGSVGGGALPATLVIHSVDADQAVIELVGFDGYFLDGNPDGVYTAPLCH